MRMNENRCSVCICVRTHPAHARNHYLIDGKTRQHAATRGNTRQRFLGRATHVNTQQHTATHYNTTHYSTPDDPAHRRNYFLSDGEAQTRAAMAPRIMRRYLRKWFKQYTLSMCVFVYACVCVFVCVCGSMCVCVCASCNETILAEMA